MYYIKFILFSCLITLLWVNIKTATAKAEKCFQSNGVPNHDVGKFPARGNPHSLKKQKIKYCVTNTPKKNANFKTIHSAVGVTLTGIPIRPGTADWYDKNSPRKHSRNDASGLNLEAIRPNEKIFGIDDHNGHVDHRGLYHYHQANNKLLIEDSPLIGYAADGFEIFHMPNEIKSSWKLKQGERPIEPYGKYDGSFKEDYEYVVGHGDLDECNGKLHEGKYRYFATDSFPYFPRCLWGNVSADFHERKRRK